MILIIAINAINLIMFFIVNLFTAKSPIYLHYVMKSENTVKNIISRNKKNIKMRKRSIRYDLIKYFNK